MSVWTAISQRLLELWLINLVIICIPFIQYKAKSTSTILNGIQTICSHSFKARTFIITFPTPTKWLNKLWKKTALNTRQLASNSNDIPAGQPQNDGDSAYPPCAGAGVVLLEELTRAASSNHDWLSKLLFLDANIPGSAHPSGFQKGNTQLNRAHSYAPNLMSNKLCTQSLLELPNRNKHYFTMERGRTIVVAFYSFMQDAEHSPNPPGI